MEQIAIPELMGVDGVIRMYGVRPSTVYSWALRGQLGRPDAKVSKRALWLRARFPDPSPELKLTQIPDLIDRGRRPLIPVVLVGPMEVAAAFEVQTKTVEAWRRNSRDLPPDHHLCTPVPLLLAGQTPIWPAEAWEPYAERRRIAYTPLTLGEWRRDQRLAIMSDA